MLCWSVASAQPPPHPGTFYAGIYADIERTVRCVEGAPGTTFEQHVWAWVPEGAGLAYITLRFDFPPNLDLTARPTFHDLMIELIITDYADGTVEWNMLFGDCPSGWLEVFTQTCMIVDENRAVIRIAGEYSMMRDCGFILHELEVLSDLRVNDPDCEQTPTWTVSWGRIKALFR
jgi:hypothetical protein